MTLVGNMAKMDEELMEYAMHKNQYLAYRSGEAKKAFKKALDAKELPKHQNCTCCC